MKFRLKPLQQQVIVITGATSGIGLATARTAARRGASLALAARNGDALAQLEQEFGGDAVATVVADVGQIDDVARIAAKALARFGHIDTWINNAGVSVFGQLEQVHPEDHRRLFDTNFWGVVNGSLEAVKHLKARGGALINLGSEVSDRAVPLQGMYSASKHAVKGFTDALRMELEHEKAPVSVTLVKPAAIDTLFTVHARNYMEREPALPPPIYAPELAAKAILFAAEHPKRDVFVGGAAKAVSLGGFHMPALMDKYMSATMFKQQQGEQPSVRARSDALHQSDPAQTLRERLGSTPKVAESAPYTALSLRSKPLLLALLSGGAAYAAWRMHARGKQSALAVL
ncbi:SDR family oxidoreductase [Massilia sp. CF038]|uniref:SDR family oxidoreductase n=1 Tax=Massilia sp. CF038 TaxID=1881045 RepID=UPI0009236851|nr:SDR family oxidoreductase [Massilia sp. CF038]SHH08393.1 Short-chain dehydrogenase [Massilia sp. CF038]